ncbi:MAG: acetolactate synthase small subunit [Candidatus Calescibacterium sp.]|nr:acetolactate synthase small subunit [Candidatus Calescibacterium sp.]
MDTEKNKMGESETSKQENSTKENDSLMLSTPSIAPLEGLSRDMLPKRPQRKTEEKPHVLTLLVENKAGVLARISGLFAGRGYNIESLCVGETNDPKVSRMTIITRGDSRVVEQIEKQLRKIIEVIKVSNITDVPHVERELMLVKVHATKENRDEIMRLVEIFRGKIVDVTLKTLTVEITGDREKTDAFLHLINPFGIKEVVRTGIAAIRRGD